MVISHRSVAGFLWICNHCNQPTRLWDHVVIICRGNSGVVKHVTRSTSFFLWSHYLNKRKHRRSKSKAFFRTGYNSRTDDINRLHYLFGTLLPSSILANTQIQNLFWFHFLLKKQKRNIKYSPPNRQNNFPQCQICKEEFTRKQLPLPYPGVILNSIKPA